MDVIKTVTIIILAMTQKPKNINIGNNDTSSLKRSTKNKIESKWQKKQKTQAILLANSLNKSLHFPVNYFGFLFLNLFNNSEIKNILKKKTLLKRKI